MKTFKFYDDRISKEVRLKKVPTKCNCLGCYFLDEETGDCLSPMPIELGADCMDHNEMGGLDHFQFHVK
jgi:hypothetical protein